MIRNGTNNVDTNRSIILCPACVRDYFLEHTNRDDDRTVEVDVDRLEEESAIFRKTPNKLLASTQVYFSYTISLINFRQNSGQTSGLH